MSFSKQSYLVIFLCVVIAIMATVSRGKGFAEAQDPASLDRRISLLEQRLYMIESNINRLQQSVATQRPPITQAGPSDRDVIRLQEVMQRVSLRVDEVECGLLKLDERTTTPSRRSSAAKSADPCRQNAETPLRLTTRP